MTKHNLLAACLGLAALHAAAAERMLVTVTHDLKAARPAETITVPWAEVNRRLPGALLQKIAAVVLFAPPSARFLADAGAPPVVVQPALTSRTARYCIAGDNICNGARLAGPGPLHVLYAVNGDVIRGAGFAARAVRG